ncbi:DegV family protein [Amylolactobacillus amylotrophicus DSM 20534]|uniref:DegV family protein n=2 Tax=Amylolactobacillus TaxID=2767876 RepID=A0A0R1YKY6_9LACO|nr:DegV family protein [Amylolactobacillus amylotrophicus DSM 20534]KRM42826.1 DegV family protein [Amylolactobacillus amylophilus DSM 20533 = JCM 1125]
MSLNLKIALVTDSTSYLTRDEIEQYNINVLPIPVIIDDKEYLEHVDFNSQQLYELEQAGAGFPQTSQPSIGELLSLFEQIKADGYDAIIAITLAGTISGFNQTLVNLANANPELHLYPFDSQITVRLMGYQVIAAAKMIAAGLNPAQIISNLSELRQQTDEIFVVDDLNNLVRGGRLSNASALVGSMLQIKPLLTFDAESHRIVSFDKVRSMKKAIAKSEKLMAKKIETNVSDLEKLRIIIYHANERETAIKIQAELTAKYPQTPNEIDEFGPVIATHLGEKAIGITWMPDVLQITY